MLRQRLRQVIGRPQAWHGFCGNDCLLPLNAGGFVGIVKGPYPAGIDAIVDQARISGRIVLKPPSTAIT